MLCNERRARQIILWREGYQDAGDGLTWNVSYMWVVFSLSPYGHTGFDDIGATLPEPKNHVCWHLSLHTMIRSV
jgi:hypothetical protein